MSVHSYFVLLYFVVVQFSMSALPVFDLFFPCVRLRSLAVSLSILTHRLLFVKYFFYSFAIFLYPQKAVYPPPQVRCFSLPYHPPSGQLAYNITSSLLCQYPFLSFLGKFLFVHIIVKTINFRGQGFEGVSAVSSRGIEIRHYCNNIRMGIQHYADIVEYFI